MSHLPLAHSPLWTPLFALDRLNSWLRSDMDSRQWFLRSALKSVIYWTKTHAILDVSKQWHIGMRRVMVKKPCLRCNGTGTWLSDYAWDWELSYEELRDQYGEPCRGCRATGTAKLLFVETTIGPLRWHTPSEKWYMSSLDVYVPFPSFYPDGYEHYEEATDWEPLQKGRARTPFEVERDILILLEAFPHHVSFALDYHHHVGIERTYRCPDLPKAKAWLHKLFHPDL